MGGYGIACGTVSGSSGNVRVVATGRSCSWGSARIGRVATPGRVERLATVLQHGDENRRAATQTGVRSLRGILPPNTRKTVSLFLDVRDPYAGWCERRTPSLLVSGGAAYSIGCRFYSSI